jgi:hypothetical protein
MSSCDGYYDKYTGTMSLNSWLDDALYIHGGIYLFKLFVTRRNELIFGNFYTLLFAKTLSIESSNMADLTMP